MLNKIKNFFLKVYKRSYGFDELGKVLIILALIFSVINLFFKNIIVSLIATVLEIIFILRFFSTNKVKRVNENRLFRRYFKLLKLKWDSRKEYKVYMCRSCGKFNRIPKGLGKVEVTCPECGHSRNTRS